MYYGWSKEFLDAGKRRLAGDTTQAAASDEVKELRREAQALEEAVADLTVEIRWRKMPRARAMPDSSRECGAIGTSRSRLPFFDPGQSLERRIGAF